MALAKPDIIHSEAEESRRSDLACLTQSGNTIDVDRVPLRQQTWDIADKFLPQV